MLKLISWTRNLKRVVTSKRYRDSQGVASSHICFSKISFLNMFKDKVDWIILAYQITNC